MSEETNTSGSLLRRLGRFSYRRRRLVLLAWIVALAVLLTASGAASGTFENRFELPGSESQAAIDLLRSGGFGTRAGFEGQLVIHAPGGLGRPNRRADGRPVAR
jgi:RND superfamily putative drug exporter